MPPHHPPFPVPGRFTPYQRAVYEGVEGRKKEKRAEPLRRAVRVINTLLLKLGSSREGGEREKKGKERGGSSLTARRRRLQVGAYFFFLEPAW